MHLLKLKFSEFLNTLEDHIFEYLKLFVSLKDHPVTIRTSAVFQIRGPVFNFNYFLNFYL